MKSNKPKPRTVELVRTSYQPTKREKVGLGWRVHDRRAPVAGSSPRIHLIGLLAEAPGSPTGPYRKCIIVIRRGRCCPLK